jgi:glycosyltransferase involved in cell wall biosynthesis
MGVTEGVGAVASGLGVFRGRSAEPSVSVVVPTLNEARNLAYAFWRLPASVSEVILVDGRSVDDTVAVARSLRKDVKVVYEAEKGKGAALRRGFAEASGDIIVMLDADGSADGGEVQRFVDVLAAGADFAKGSRFLPGAGSVDITRLRSWGNRVLCEIVNVVCRTKYTDLCYGYNAFWRDCLEFVDVDVPGFEVETRLNMRIAQAGLSVVEVPSFEYSRVHGSSNLRAVRDGWRVLRTIVRSARDGRSVRRRSAAVVRNRPADTVLDLTRLEGTSAVRVQHVEDGDAVSSLAPIWERV